MMQLNTPRHSAMSMQICKQITKKWFFFESCLHFCIVPHPCLKTKTMRWIGPDVALCLTVSISWNDAWQLVSLLAMSVMHLCVNFHALQLSSALLWWFPLKLLQAWVLCILCTWCEAAVSDACHEKTDLEFFVVVIPKEGWHQSFFWYDTDL